MKVRNKIMIILTILLLILGLILIIIKSTRVSKVERIKLEDVSSDIINYMYNIDNKEYQQVEKYLLFALDYSLNENNKEKVTLKEVEEIINDRFDNDFDDNDFLDLGITPEMSKRDIHFEHETSTYTINKQQLTSSDTAEVPIYSYAINKIRKSSSNKYIVTYDKYKINYAYKILDFYEKKNLPKDSIPNENGELINIEIENKTIDTSDITKYIHGEANRGVLNKYLTKECLQNIGENQGKLTIYYIVRDSKIIVDKIKTE